jgi:hypothetical protein
MPNRCGSLVALAVASLVLTACGGSSTHSVTSSAKNSTNSTASSSGASVTSGPVRATLRGENHNPTAKKNWTYTVTATDAHGHPLSGTVLTEFAFQGTVEGREAPPFHPLKNGRLKDVIQYPAESVGFPIVLQVVVHTHLGSVTLHWPVAVGQ